MHASEACYGPPPTRSATPDPQARPPLQRQFASRQYATLAATWESSDPVRTLVGALAWPCFAVFLIWRLGPSIRVFIESIGEGSLKALGVELSAKRLDAVAAVASAQIAKSENAGGNTIPASMSIVASSLESANNIVTSTALRHLESRRVLWVDDNPDNNLWERKALEAMGVRVTPVTSTQSAKEALTGLGGGYDLIISDMTRAGNKMAGYELLDQLRQEGRATPFIIYAGSANPEQEQAAIKRGATGRASDPEKLMRLVTETLMRTV